jgi:Transglutaminase-like superfamily
MPQLAKLRRALRRGPRALGLFVRAWLALLAADLCLRWLSFPRVERLFAPPAVRPAAAAGDEAVRLRVWAVDAAARHHLRPMTCLPRTLGLRWLLGRAGIPTDLRIGVARQGGRLLAHAWVERDGVPVGERAGELSSFHPLREMSVNR